jgi:RNA polymerase sigma-70 factor, ECF subfamily
MNDFKPPFNLDGLLQQAQEGSSEALWKLLAGSRDFLLHLANRDFDPRLRAKANPSDVVNETILEAQRDFQGFRGTTPKEWLAWLGKLLRHNLANFNRSFQGTAKREVSREVPFDGRQLRHEELQAHKLPDPTPSDIVSRQERLERLNRHLNTLPEQYRQVILLRYLEGKSFQQIGDALGRSAEAARRLWSRAIEKLHPAFDSSHE